GGAPLQSPHPAGQLLNRIARPAQPAFDPDRHRDDIHSASSDGVDPAYQAIVEERRYEGHQGWRAKCALEDPVDGPPDWLRLRLGGQDRLEQSMAVEAASLETEPACDPGQGHQPQTVAGPAVGVDEAGSDPNPRVDRRLDLGSRRHQRIEDEHEVSVALRLTVGHPQSLGSSARSPVDRANGVGSRPGPELGQLHTRTAGPGLDVAGVEVGSNRLDEAFHLGDLGHHDERPNRRYDTHYLEDLEWAFAVDRGGSDFVGAPAPGD